MKKEIIIGIDLGTTNSLAASVSENGAEIIENGNESGITPSIVTFDSGKTYVGIDAQKRRTKNPETTFYSFKRFMGRGEKDIKEELSKFPFPVSYGKRGIILLGKDSKKVSPEQLSALVLKQIKEKAEKVLYCPIKKAVITVPAYFDDSQRQATGNAAEIAGIEIVRMINEPTAAAISYGLDEKKKGIIAVYDFGGGTFDVSILELKGKIFKVLATYGNTQLGGDDLDHLIYESLLDQMKVDQNDTTLDPVDIQVLKRCSEEIKFELTTQNEVLKEIKLQHKKIHTKTRFSRSQFENLIQGKIKETLEHLDQALKEANLGVENLDEVVMVGGSTRIPLVRKMVEKHVGLPPHIRINPDEVVAIGAGIQGHLLSGGRRDFLLMDVVPLALGIETIGGTFSKLIIKNASLPAKATEIFSTSVDNQSGVDINIFQGERDFIKDCRLLGEFRLKGIPSMPAGLPKIELTFFVNVNGMLVVTAIETRSQIKADIEIMPSHGLKKSEVKQMIEGSFEFAMEDFNNRNLMDYKTKAKSILKGLEKVWDKVDQFLTKKEKSDILQECEILKQEIQRDNFEALKKTTERVGDLTRVLADQLMGNAAKKALEES